MLFGKKKVEAKKELQDVNKIQESIAPVGNNETYESSSTEELMKQVNPAMVKAENPAEFSAQQLLSGSVPKIETIQTPNVAVKVVENEVSVPENPPAESVTLLSMIHPASHGPMPSIEAPESVPLFIKLERYKNIMQTISEIKETVARLRSAFNVFSEMEKMRTENLNLLGSAIQKVETRISELDTEFQKPVGNIRTNSLNISETTREFPGGRMSSAQLPPVRLAPVVPELQPVADDNLAKMIQNLRVQINRLKEELNDISAEKKEMMDDLDQLDA